MRREKTIENTCPMFRGEPSEMYDIHSLNVIYETSPEAIREVLPPCLFPVEGYPYALALFNDIGTTNSGPGYKETGILLPCKTRDGDLGLYIYSMPVTSDMGLLVWRETRGFPKKIANNVIIREGDHCYASSERNGIKFLELEGTVSDTTNDPEKFAEIAPHIFPKSDTDKPLSVMFNINFAFAADGKGVGGFEYPPRLYKFKSYRTTYSSSLAIGNVKLEWSDHDPVAKLEVKKIVGASISHGDLSMGPGELVEELDPDEIRPYCFGQYDIPPYQTRPDFQRPIK